MLTKPSELFNAAMLYKKQFTLTAIAFIIAIFSVIPISAQQANDKPVYVILNYIKVPQGKGDMYTQMLKSYSQKIVEYRFKEGAYLGWYVHAVRMPAGSAREYDYVTVVITNTFKDIFEDRTPTKEIYAKAFPSITDQMFADIGKQFDECRQLVKREVYTFTAGLNTSSKPSKYVQVDFMKSAEGKYADYIKMEKEVYMPVHKERVALGVLDDWGLYEKQMPYDSHSDYDFITANFYSDINNLMNTKYADAFKKVWPKQDMTKLNTSTEANRKLVRTELWELIQFVDGTTVKK